MLSYDEKQDVEVKIYSIETLLDDMYKSATQKVVVNFKNKSSNKYWFIGLELDFFNTDPTEFRYSEDRKTYTLYQGSNKITEISERNVSDLIIEVVF